jgi:hypothetical protein
MHRDVDRRGQVRVGPSLAEVVESDPRVEGQSFERPLILCVDAKLGEEHRLVGIRRWLVQHVERHTARELVDIVVGTLDRTVVTVPMEVRANLQ